MLRSGQPSAGGDGVPLAILLSTLASDWRGRLPSAVAVIAGPDPVAFFLVVGSDRFFDCGFTQPVGLTQPRNSPHDRSRLLLARLPGSGEMERMGRWAHVAGRPVSVWLVVPQVQRMSPALCWSTVYIQPGCPCVIDSSPPLAVFATKSQPDPSSNLSVPSCALPSHPAQRHPQIFVVERRVFPGRPTYIRIQLPTRLSVLSQQPVASLSCVVYQACPRSVASNGSARLQKPAPPRNPGSTPLSDKALDEDDTALEAASPVPPSLQRPVSPARPCPPSLWHTGTQESLVPGPDA